MSRCERSGEQVFSRGMESVHGVALESRNLDWLAVVAMHNAGTFAQHFNGTGTRTTSAQNVGVENAKRRAAQVAGGDALDESRHINVRGTCGGAGGVET